MTPSRAFMVTKTALADIAATAARSKNMYEAKFSLRMVTEDAAGMVQL